MAAEGKTEAQPHEENVWQELLKQATRKQTQANASLVVVGDTHCGKSMLLSRLSDRHLHPNNREYILDYSYIDVKNKASADKDEVVARLNVWQLSDPKSIGIVPIEPSALRQTVYAVVVNLADPSTVLSSLRQWLQTVKAHTEGLMEKLSVEAQQDLKRRISETISYFVDVSLKSTAADTTRVTEEDKQRVEADLEKPAINLGVPIIVVGCKGDMLRPAKGYTPQADEQFEFLTKHLRKICHDYGATLVFTSTTARVGIDVFEDYVYHRIYGFELTHKAKATGSVDDFGVFVPSGYDTEQLIKDAPHGKWSDDTPYETVFPTPVKHSKHAKEHVTVPDNNTFFKALDEQLKSGAPLSRTVGGGMKYADPRQAARSARSPAGSMDPSPVTSPTGLSATTPKASSKFAFPQPSGGAGSSSGAAAYAAGVSDNAVAKQFFAGLLSSTSRPGQDRGKVAAMLAAKKQQGANGGGSGSSS